MPPELMEFTALGLVVAGLAAVLVEGLVKDAGVFAVRLTDRYADAVRRARAGFAPGH